jgi:hypothetical protein
MKTANNRTEDATIVDPSTGLIAPTTLKATAVSASLVNVSWDAVTGSSGYTVRRTFNRGAEQLFPASTPNFSDSTVSPNTAYLYSVTAMNGATAGPATPIDFATTVVFAPLVAGQTRVTASRSNEMRTAITALRASAPGVAAVPFAEPIAPGVVVKAAHYNEMLMRLNEALTALGFSAITFTPPAASGTTIQSSQMLQLQKGVE